MNGWSGGVPEEGKPRKVFDEVHDEVHDEVYDEVYDKVYGICEGGEGFIVLPAGEAASGG
jgi:hypothetical protein